MPTSPSVNRNRCHDDYIYIDDDDDDDDDDDSTGEISRRHCSQGLVAS